MVKADDDDTTKSNPERVDTAPFRTKEVEFGFVNVPKEPEPPTPASPASPASPEQCQHDPVVCEIAELKYTLDLAVAGLLKMSPKTRAPREGTRNLLQGFTELYSDKPVPKLINDIRADLEPIYRREGWGPVPERDAVADARKVFTQKPDQTFGRS